MQNLIPISGELNSSNLKCNPVMDTDNLRVKEGSTFYCCYLFQFFVCVSLSTSSAS